MENQKNIILILIIVLFSCNNENYQNYVFENYNLEINIPKSFEKVSEEKISEKYEIGTKILEKNNIVIVQNQKNLLSVTKGEFTNLQIKYVKLNSETSKDYINHWNNLKKQTFKILQKEKLTEAKIDSISRIVKINDVKFYLFETNTRFLDLNNKMVNFKSLRYSSLIDNLDLVININYANKIDAIDIFKIIESIKISKK